jgi:hypothetical protein
MDKVNLTFLLGGNAVCGQENKPDSCLECDKLISCVMDMFYDSVGDPDPLDILEAYFKHRAEKTFDTRTRVVFEQAMNIVHEIRDNPRKAIERGQVEGWLK